MRHSGSASITIIGGGLVGSLASVFLRKRGFGVDVFEKRPDPRKNLKDEGRSINLVVTSRGRHALKTVGLWEKVKEICVEVRGRMMHSVSGELAFQPYGHSGECNDSVSRGDLNRILIEEAAKLGASFEFEKRLTEVPEEGPVLGTDGMHSVVREWIDSKSKTKSLVEELNYGYRELIIDKERGKVLERNALHIWPRGHYMMMALPNFDGSFTVTLYLPFKGDPSFESVPEGKSLEVLFKKVFPDASLLFTDLSSQMEAHPVGRMCSVWCPQWCHGKVALMGDAAHGMVPFFGQGMNCGFEDVTTLDGLIEKGESWETIFEAYFKARKPNADAICEMALENFVEMRDKVGDPKFLLMKAVEHRLEEEFPKMYRGRYGMVAYTLIPYATAQKAGKLQSEILSELCRGIERASELDLQAAARLLEKRWVPFLEGIK